ncbi:hypothetical protein [Cellulosimicrobium cellulans]|uniref:hypothetical protein n=1 Tax=Cellulosimicrobium cellulans TaxID=1710 RepID=UPI00240719AE|nr:hypothetical protein [Cellulosimicrobium cellulans]MDF9877466.1 flavin-binding protein dodecin [Cellulosimicrobium cellulans]
MSARTELVTALKANLPSTYRVIGYNPTIDGVPKPTVMVWQTTLTRADDFGLQRVNVTFTVWVLVGQENSGNADNALDAALERVLASLQPIDWVEWTTAERGVFGPPDGKQFHGYQVTVEAVATIDTEGA